MILLSQDTIKRYQANQGYVYLIHALGTNRYKIGRSVNPIVRFETLKKQSPYPLQIIDCFWTPDSIEDEKRLHQYFKSDRVFGEWFVFEGVVKLDKHKGFAGKATVKVSELVWQTVGEGLDSRCLKWVYEIFAKCQSFKDLADADKYFAVLMQTACDMSIGIEDKDGVIIALSAAIITFHRYVSASTVETEG